MSDAGKGDSEYIKKKEKRVVNFVKNLMEKTFVTVVKKNK